MKKVTLMVSVMVMVLASLWFYNGAKATDEQHGPVIVTGGKMNAPLPEVKDLGNGYVEIDGHVFGVQKPDPEPSPQPEPEVAQCLTNIDIQCNPVEGGTWECNSSNCYITVTGSIHCPLIHGWTPQHSPCTFDSEGTECYLTWSAADGPSIRTLAATVTGTVNTTTNYGCSSCLSKVETYYYIPAGCTSISFACYITGTNFVPGCPGLQECDSGCGSVLPEPVPEPTKPKSKTDGQ